MLLLTCVINCAAGTPMLQLCPVVSALGSELDNPGSSPGWGKVLCPWDKQKKKCKLRFEGWLNLHIRPCSPYSFRGSVVEHQTVQSEGLRFNSLWELTVFTLSHTYQAQNLPSLLFYLQGMNYNQSCVLIKITWCLGAWTCFLNLEWKFSQIHKRLR